MLTKIIGYTYFFLCPFIGGMLPYITISWIMGEDYMPLFAWHSMIWVCMFPAFDGSKYQRSL